MNVWQRWSDGGDYKRDQMVARYIYSTVDTWGRGVRELIGRWPRGFVIAAITAPLVLAVAALAANRTVGPTVAMGLLATGCGIMFGALLLLAGSRLRRADEALRLGKQALETVPHAIFVVDSLRPGQSQSLRQSGLCRADGLWRRRSRQRRLRRPCDLCRPGRSRRTRG